MICKIWGVKAHIKSGVTTGNIKKGISNLLRYLEDEQKIHGQTPENPFDVQEYSNDDLEKEIQYIQASENFFRVVNYMSDEHKTKNTYISGYLCDPDHAIEEFMLAKIQNLERVGKELEDDLGNQGYHIVQSFPDDLDISDDEVHQCGIELCEKLKVHQAVITSHLHPIYDENGMLIGKCKHNHILINSHIHPDYIDPLHPERMKYHDCRETYAQLREWNDEIAISHGLPVILTQQQDKSYSWYATEMDNQKKSWKKRIMYDLENAMQTSASWKEYKAHLLQSGYQIKEGKYETYTAPDGVHKIRGATLGIEYTKEYMLDYWNLKNDFAKMMKKDFKKEVENQEENLLEPVELAEFLQQKNHAYHIEIPRMNKRDHSRYTFQIPLKYNFEPLVAKKYIKTDLYYPVLDDERNNLGRILGEDLHNILFMQNLQQYLQFKRWEEEETKRNEKNDLKFLFKNSQKNGYFSVPGWNNSKTREPYRVGLYDKETGRRRSLLEHVLIFAMVIINKEMPEFALTEGQRAKLQRDDEKLALILLPPSQKKQGILEALLIAKQEDIKTPEELQERLMKTGKTHKILKSKWQKNLQVKNKMQPIFHALTVIKENAALCEDIFAMETGPEKQELVEKNKDIIREYKDAKALLYQHKIDSAEKEKDFLERWEFNQKQDKYLSKQLEAVSKQYTRLKKLKYQVDLAQDKAYCYGTNEQIQKYQVKEKGKDEGRNKG